MKRAALELTLIMAFLFSAVAGAILVNVARANPMPQPRYVTIESDGSIEPETGFIEKTGNVYSLTTDLSRRYAVIIRRSNIVFDGAGHLIGRAVPSDDFGYGYSTRLEIESVTNVTVKDIEVSGFMENGVSIENSNRSVFLRVKARSLGLRNSNFNTIAESNIGGLGLWNSNLNTIADSNFGDYSFLICLSNNNTLMRNNITWAGFGYGGTILGGLDGSFNTFFENNFVGKPLFITANGTNYWDNGSVGNYWSGYTGTDANGDGIDDTPYDITTKARDRYPLMKPWDSTKPFETVPPRISISSPERKIYNDTSVPLIFSIYESASSISYSIDGQDNVTITGNVTLTNLANGFHNVTVYVTDRSGNIGVSETIYFTVDTPDSFLVEPIVALTVISVMVVGAGLVFYLRKRRSEDEQS